MIARTLRTLAAALWLASGCASDAPPGWRPGPGSQPGDAEACHERAADGQRRFRACLEQNDVDAIADPREAWAAERACAQRSFAQSRYGPYDADFAGCMRRRGWSPPTATER